MDLLHEIEALVGRLRRNALKLGEMQVSHHVSSMLPSEKLLAGIGLKEMEVHHHAAYVRATEELSVLANRYLQNMADALLLTYGNASVDDLLRVGAVINNNRKKAAQSLAARMDFEEFLAITKSVQAALDSVSTEISINIYI